MSCQRRYHRFHGDIPCPGKQFQTILIRSIRKKTKNPEIAKELRFCLRAVATILLVSSHQKFTLGLKLLPHFRLTEYLTRAPHTESQLGPTGSGFPEIPVLGEIHTTHLLRGGRRVPVQVGSGIQQLYPGPGQQFRARNHARVKRSARNQGLFQNRARCSATRIIVEGLLEKSNVGL